MKPPVEGSSAWHVFIWGFQERGIIIAQHSPSHTCWPTHKTLGTLVRLLKKNYKTVVNFSQKLFCEITFKFHISWSPTNTRSKLVLQVELQHLVASLHKNLGTEDNSLVM